VLPALLASVSSVNIAMRLSKIQSCVTRQQNSTSGFNEFTPYKNVPRAYNNLFLYAIIKARAGNEAL